eukprot:3413992-Pyramimonas_sp.AAC.1
MISARALGIVLGRQPREDWVRVKLRDVQGMIENLNTDEPYRVETVAAPKARTANALEAASKDLKQCGLSAPARAKDGEQTP